MTKSNIHPTAIVESGAQLGRNVTIEPYAIVKGTVTLGDDVVIKSHVYLDGNTTVGEGTQIWPFASIGTKSQDLKYRGEITHVRIGKHCQIREYTTINSSCGEGTSVEVGDSTLIMAYCHVGHNCQVGNHVVLSNGVALAGHVRVYDHAIVGGHTPVHQNTRIGSYAMVGGFSRVLHDVPPFTLGSGLDVYRLGGLNLIGLKRHGFPLETRRALSRAFRIMFRSGLHLDEAIRKIEAEIQPLPEIEEWLDFARTSKRGLSGMQGISQAGDGDFEDADEAAECAVSQ